MEDAVSVPLLCNEWGLHRWEKWEIINVQETMTPVGAAYPAETRGKTFQATKQKQVRKCSVCGITQVRSL
jgi:hypothetical protein